MPERSGWFRDPAWPGAALTPSVEEARREAEEASWHERIPDFEGMLVDARTLLLFRFPFHGRLALRLRWAFTERVATMALRADGFVFFNPMYLERIGSARLPALLAHAVMHLALGHFQRVEGREHDRWNRATDVVVDDLVRRSGLRPPACGKAPPVWYDPTEMDAEDVYDRLPPPARSGASPGGGDPRPGYGTATGDCDHAATGELMRRARDGTGDRVLSAAEWQMAARDAARHAAAIGTAPAGLERFLEELVAPQLPWSVLLRRWLTPLLTAGVAWHRPSRRGPAVRNRLFALQGVRTTFPGPEPELATVVVAWDLSGSVSAEEGARMLAETRSILAQYRRPVRVLCFDAEVTVDQDIRDVTEIVPRGGGGTSLIPVFRRIEDEPGTWGRPACVIVFTDLFAIYPDAPPPFPVLFVDVDGTFGRPPFGEVIRLGHVEVPALTGGIAWDR